MTGSGAARNSVHTSRRVVAGSKPHRRTLGSYLGNYLNARRVGRLSPSKRALRSLFDPSIRPYDDQRISLGSGRAALSSELGQAASVRHASLMPRSIRSLLPGYVCHLTHRCHNMHPNHRVGPMQHRGSADNGFIPTPAPNPGSARQKSLTPYTAFTGPKTKCKLIL